jgi:iron complex outermembrane receptor protein
MKKLLLTVFLFSNFIFPQDKLKDTIKGTEQKLDEVIVQAVRAKFSSPISFSNVTKKDISSRNLGQDLPILLNYLPSVVTTSDAGAGIGYTGIRIRGVSPQSTNITINGIPFNDAESHGTYWVNLPDFSSSVENLQVQRGVGTSTNGSGAFGASINILTDAVSDIAFASISSSIGSYNTFKNTIKFSTGLINNFELSGRLSKINSDGYVDRAFSDLKSYFIQGSYTDENTLIKALTFGGYERGYQAWFGVTSDQIKENRRQNPYTYENEIDDYKQDHFQFHWNEKLNSRWSANLGLNYTDGRGYFEQYREDDPIDGYSGIVGSDLDPNGNILGTTDLIRRRWLDNDFYVLNASVDYNSKNLNLNFNSFYSSYSGDHYGEIIWARTFSGEGKIRDRYYEGNGNKKDFSVFSKASFNLGKKTEIYADLQFRKVNYKTSGITSDLVNMILDKEYNFFNPKFGFSYKFKPNSMLYLSYARANREPSRSDYESNLLIKPEELNDLELGWRIRNEKIKLNINSFYMLYSNQLVLTGELDDVGTPIRTNSGNSYRLGIEIDNLLKLSERIKFQTNITVSSNKNKEIISKVDGEIYNYGKTNISFSPNLIASNIFSYMPNEYTTLSLLSKYVSDQYMSNNDSKNSILESYFINDLNFTYQIRTNKLFDSIIFSVLINNLFNIEYISNGYYYTYDDTWSDPNRVTTIEGTGYYPQATRNFLAGIQLRF